jgi:hypothetical protein
VLGVTSTRGERQGINCIFQFTSFASPMKLMNQPQGASPRFERTYEQSRH